MMMPRCKCHGPVRAPKQTQSSIAFVSNLASSVNYSRPFLEKRMGQEVDGESLGQEYKGYIFKITGGNDAQGFPMKQGIMRMGRARILFKKSK